MPIVTDSRLNSEADIKFETYRGYLDAVRRHIYQTYGSWKHFGRTCIDQTLHMQGIGVFDQPWVERFLKIAWNTEFILSDGAKDVELVRINNQWSPIQAYYAIYACGEALAYVLDGNKADGHQKTLTKLTDYFEKNSLSPWNLSYEGPRGRTCQDHKPHNFSADIRIPHNLQRSDVTPQELIAKCLKAEHANRVDDTWQKRRCQFKYNFDPGRTSLLHFMYRLRIKSNYKEIDLFVSQAPAAKILNFNTSLQYICFYTLLYMEVALARKCKKSFLLALGDKYLTVNPRAHKLKRRLEFYNSQI